MKKINFIFIFIIFSVFSRQRIILSAELAEEEKNKQCYDCHLKEKELFSLGTVHIPVEDGDCSACHKDHGGENKLVLKNKIEKKICFECHEEKGKKRFVHKPIADGKCTSCHNPHAANEKKLLGKKVPEICFSCHKNESNKKYVHTPYRDGNCLICHDPHESDTDALIKPEFGISSSSKVVVDFCIKCHKTINKGKNVHLVVMAGECDSCHNTHASEYPSQLVDSLDKICYRSCHKTYEKMRYLHKPVKEGNCTSCHDPHNSPNEKLLLPKDYVGVFHQDKLCYLCHKNMLREYTVKIHRPIIDGKCGNCHMAHGSENQKLLVYDKDQDLCLSCHRLSEKEDPINKKHKLDRQHTKCLECHNPHGK